MAKNQAKDTIALVLMLAGIAAVIASIIINAVMVIGKVGWLGATQLSNIGHWVTIYKESPSALFVSLALFICGGIACKVGAYHSK